MTNEERDLITQFVARTGGRPAASGFGGSVPAAGQPDLPPVDPQADALIGELFARYPEARYRLTQLAFVQEHALAAASNQIQQMQAQIQQLQQQIAQQQQAPAASPWGAAAQPQPQPSRGFFGGLFGGGQQSAPSPQYAPQPQYAPPPQYAPGYQPGMFQQSGNGFLGSALRTATGVAGGVLAAEAISSLFSPHNAYASGLGYGGGGFGAAPGTVINETNYIQEGSGGGSPASSPWGSPDPYDQGGAAKSYDQGWNDQPAQDTGWQDAGQSDSGWQDASSSDDSGWTDDNT
jgi:uncharacterized protein